MDNIHTLHPTKALHGWLPERATVSVEEIDDIMYYRGTLDNVCFSDKSMLRRDSHFPHMALINLTFVNSTLRNSNFAGSLLKNVDFEGCTFVKSANFMNCVMEDVNFKNCKFVDLKYGLPFENNHLTNVIFECTSPVIDESTRLHNTVMRNVAFQTFQTFQKPKDKPNDK